MPTARQLDKIHSERIIGSLGLAEPIQHYNHPGSLSINETRGEHIIVFVHGFQASRQDFVLFKNCL